MAAIFQNGRHMLVFHRISGRQVDSGRWTPRLSSAHSLASPPQVCSRVYTWLMVYFGVSYGNFRFLVVQVTTDISKYVYVFVSRGLYIKFAY